MPSLAYIALSSGRRQRCQACARQRYLAGPRWKRELRFSHHLSHEFNISYPFRLLLLTARISLARLLLCFHLLTDELVPAGLCQVPNRPRATGNPQCSPPHKVCPPVLESFLQLSARVDPLFAFGDGRGIMVEQWNSWILAQDLPL